MNYKHFILTRSCYRQLDINYLRNRLRLLKRFSSRSLSLQTNQRFVWIVRMDPRSPMADAWREHLQSLPFPVFTIDSPARHNDASDTLSTHDWTWRDAIHQHLDGSETHVLTTRMDDDDVISPTFVERLQRRVEGQPAPEKAVVYNFRSGYVVRLHSQGTKYCKWDYRTNQFASLLSPIDNLSLVNDANHNRIDKLGSVRIVDDKPAFVWIRHPRSKSPGGRFKATRPVQELASQFPALEGVV